MTYDELLQSADTADVNVVDYSFTSDNIKGLYCDRTIALNTNIKTTSERACVLAEELGHYHTTTGNILDQSSVSNRKQEYHARIWAYNRLIGLNGIISAYRAGCRNSYDMAKHLDVTEEFLQEALSCYRQKYGIYTEIDNYVIYFEPTIGVFELI